MVKFYVSSRKSEVLQFDGLLLSKSYKVSVKKVQKSYISWHWKVMQSLKKKLFCGFKYDLRNLVIFHPSTQESGNFTLRGYFCPMCIRFDLKRCRGVIFHDTEEWCTVWINPDLVVSKISWEIGWTFIRVLKSQKNCTLMGLFCRKDMFYYKIL